MKRLELAAPRKKPPQRRPPWDRVPDEEWNDWHWQMRNRLNSLERLREALHLTPDEEMAVAMEPELKLGITPYFANLMDADNPRDPLRMQMVPTTNEFVLDDPDLEDPLGEDVFSPVPGLTHRYPDRVLVLITDQCVSYCRFCTRRRLVGTGEMPVSKPRIEAIADYIAHTPQIRDILISGGDGLFVSDEILDFVLSTFRRIPHVEIIRFGTRVPVFLPQRITPQLVKTLKKYHPIWMNIHVNHPNEITPELAEACDRLAGAGVPLGCQSVLMAGINDCPNIMKRLVHELLKIRVRPYYLYQCDLSQGIGHFRTPVSVGLNIIENLRGHTTGFAVPTFVIDAPGGGGKVPVMPQYLISMSEARVVVRNFEGAISTYTQPKRYTSHDTANCIYCQQAGPVEGVAKLLAGEQLTLEPTGLSRHGRRRNGQKIELPVVTEKVRVSVK